MPPTMAPTWQEIDEGRQVCHSWPDLIESRITAMTAAISLLVLALLVAAVLATLRDVYDDGLGRRRPPASHHPEPFDPPGGLRTC